MISTRQSKTRGAGCWAIALAAVSLLALLSGCGAGGRYDLDNEYAAPLAGARKRQRRCDGRLSGTALARHDDQARCKDRGLPSGAHGAVPRLAPDRRIPEGTERGVALKRSGGASENESQAGEIGADPSTGAPARFARK